jgi:very-short-patch-repair endonuclease
MSYYNQREHAMLDRQLVRELLLHLTRAHTSASPTPEPRATHLEHLLRQASSELERRWLRWLNTYGYRLPDRAQVFVESCQTRPDFLYEDYQAAVYIDGPPHDYADRQAHDRQQTEAMEDYGYTVIRFGHADDWGQIAARYPHIFGMAQTMQAASPRAPDKATGVALALELFDEKWHALVHELAQELSSGMIEPGGDVALGGRVVGRYFARKSPAQGSSSGCLTPQSQTSNGSRGPTGAGHMPVVVAMSSGRKWYRHCTNVAGAVDVSGA